MNFGELMCVFTVLPSMSENKSIEIEFENKNIHNGQVYHPYIFQLGNPFGSICLHPFKGSNKSQSPEQPTKWQLKGSVFPYSQNAMPVSSAYNIDLRFKSTFHQPWIVT